MAHGEKMLFFWAQGKKSLTTAALGYFTVYKTGFSKLTVIKTKYLSKVNI
jgi:hypothetical protein